jgi:hypothetical protein
LWTAGKLKRAEELHAQQQEEEREQQYVLDDYLESIDRRYKRLKKVDKSSKEENKGSGGFTNALQWLTQSESSSDTKEKRKQEDALYVFGLAELASTRLLQQHQLPIPASKLNKSIVIDIGFQNEPIDPPSEVTVPETQQRQSSTNAISTPATTTLSKAAVIVQMLHRIPISRLNDFSKVANQVALNAIRVSGRVVFQALGSFLSLVSNTTGGKHSLQLASILVAAVGAFAISLIRPVTKA